MNETLNSRFVYVIYIDVPPPPATFQCYYVHTPFPFQLRQRMLHIRSGPSGYENCPEFAIYTAIGNFTGLIKGVV